MRHVFAIHVLAFIWTASIFAGEKYIKQGAGDVAYRQTSGDLNVSGICVNQGGIVASLGGDKCNLKNLRSESAPSGGGVYAFIVATGAGREFTLDNSGLKNAWIVNGGEAALRVMGGCKSMVITSVDFCCRKHDVSDGGSGKKMAPVPKLSPLQQPKPPKGVTYDWWKQVCQFRDMRKGLVKNCRIVGPFDVGQAMDQLSKQHVDDLTFENDGLTHEPHFTDPKSYGTVTRHNCWKMDEAGNRVTDFKGHPVMWSNKVWKGK